jgi:F0F1-type ATP synthase membrane subunit b/b'
MKTLEEYLTKVTKNVAEDRAAAKALLMELMKWMKPVEERHKKVGMIAAKYLETLQRSNEQLVKITSLIQKNNPESAKMTQEDKEEIFNIIQEED